jgi:hypothetical protein
MVEITSWGLVQRGDTIIKSAGAENGTTTIHTVTSEMGFYLTHANITVICEEANQSGSVYLQCDTGGNAVFRTMACLSVMTLTGAVTMPSLSLSITPSLPMLFPTGTVFRIFSNASRIWGNASIMGWEEKYY